MTKARLEAFSDGVIAIIITIMVLELKIPAGHDWPALRPLVPMLLTYALSFMFVGIYWTNHHHLLHATQKINGRVLWANLHLLFWLSLTPLAMAWMGENQSASLPNAAYGSVLLLAALAYWILAREIIAVQGHGSLLEEAIGNDWKGKASMIAYMVAIVMAFINQWISDVLYVAIALSWLIPDRRIESRLERHPSSGR